MRAARQSVWATTGIYSGWRPCRTSGAAVMVNGTAPIMNVRAIDPKPKNRARDKLRKRPERGPLNRPGGHDNAEEGAPPACGRFPRLSLPLPPASAPAESAPRRPPGPGTSGLNFNREFARRAAANLLKIEQPVDLCTLLYPIQRLRRRVDLIVELLIRKYAIWCRYSGSQPDCAGTWTKLFSILLLTECIRMTLSTLFLAEPESRRGSHRPASLGFLGAKAHRSAPLPELHCLS